jgi:hypothetical protein
MMRKVMPYRGGHIYFSKDGSFYLPKGIDFQKIKQHNKLYIVNVYDHEIDFTDITFKSKSGHESRFGHFIKIAMRTWVGHDEKVQEDLFTIHPENPFLPSFYGLYQEE